MFNLNAIETTKENLTVAFASVSGVEILDHSPLGLMGPTGEIIKLSLQTIIALAAVIKYLRKPKKIKANGEQ